MYILSLCILTIGIHHWLILFRFWLRLLGHSILVLYFIFRVACKQRKKRFWYPTTLHCLKGHQGPHTSPMYQSKMGTHRASQGVDITVRPTRSTTLLGLALSTFGVRWMSIIYCVQWVPLFVVQALFFSYCGFLARPSVFYTHSRVDTTHSFVW
jgi:hypothetical protein